MRKRRTSSRTKKQSKAFLATDEGQRWLEEKIAAKRRNRPDPGPAPERLTRTKFPFVAIINEEKAWVSRNAYGIQFDYET